MLIPQAFFCRRSKLHEVQYFYTMDVLNIKWSVQTESSIPSSKSCLTSLYLKRHLLLLACPQCMCIIFCCCLPLFYTQNSSVFKIHTFPLNYMRCSTQTCFFGPIQTGKTFLTGMLHIAFVPQDSAWHIALLHFSSLLTLTTDSGGLVFFSSNC